MVIKVAELSPVDENNSPQYSYEANDGQIYVANSIEDAIKQCSKFLAKIAAQNGGFETVQKILEFSSRGLEKKQEDINSLVNEKDNHQSNKHQDQDLQIKNQSDTEIDDKRPSVIPEITVIDQKVSLDQLDYQPLGIINDKKSSIALNHDKLPDTPSKTELIFHDNLNQVVEFKEVEIIVDHTRNDPLLFEDKVNIVELSDEVEQTIPLVEINQDQEDLILIDQDFEVESGNEDLLLSKELIQEEIREMSFDLEVDYQLDLDPDQLDLKSPIEVKSSFKETIISDQEINLTISLIEAFDVDPEETNLVDIIYPSVENLIQANLDLVEPLHLSEIEQQTNQRSLEESFVGLVKILEENQSELNDLDYIKSSLVLIEDIVTSWDQQQELQTDLVKQIFQLLIQLGYNQPRQYLIDFVAQYGFNFLIENLRYLLLLSSNSIQFEKISNASTVTKQNTTNQDIFGFIFNLIGRFIIGFQPLFD